jgi:NADH-quinone oxidoreductase subunit L
VWLTKAIRAPTPTRALVHRRTLVTAGVGVALLSTTSSHPTTHSSILTLRALTLLLSRLMARRERDGKKVVALRTLRQISLCLVLLRVGGAFLALTHLLAHALFKRVLFLTIGAQIYTIWGEQERRRHGPHPRLVGNLTLQTSLIRLTGLIFTRGAVRKELLLSALGEGMASFLFKRIILVSLFLTFTYSIRLRKGLRGGPSLQKNNSRKEAFLSYRVLYVFRLG